MGLIDFIKGVINPDIISQYDDIMNNHSEAFRKWRGRQIVGTLSSLVDFAPTYKDKHYIATHRDEIMAVEREIAEERAFEKRRQEVINAASQYPHAFYALVKRLSIASIPGIEVTLPGTRKSKYSQKKRTQSATSTEPIKKISPRVIDIGQILYTNFNLDSFFNPIQPFRQQTSSFNRETKPKRSIKTLEKAEYEKLYTYLQELPKEEKKLVKALNEEDIIIKFEDEILDNSTRCKYYKNFIESESVTERIEEYCISHITELDKFINSAIDAEYRRIRLKYPRGTRYYQDSYIQRRHPDKEDVINNEDKIASLDALCKKYYELKRKYPIGVPALEKYYSYDDGKNSAELSIVEVAELEEEIIKFEQYSQEADFYNQWEQSQKDFNTKCRNLRDSVLSGWGCYIYDIPFLKIKPNGDPIDGKFSVWQMFCDSYGEDKTIDTTFYPNWANNRDKIPDFYSHRRHYLNHIYDKIVAYIQELRKDCTGENELYVMFACTEADNRNSLINYHFSYLKSQLEVIGVKYDLLKDDSPCVENCTKYVVIDLVTTNEGLKKNVTSILDIKRTCRCSCIKEKRFKCITNIVYISLLKGYDTDEMLNLNKTKEAEIKQQEERKKREEEEKRRKEEEERKKELQRQEEERRKQMLVSSLKNCVSSWNKLSFNLPYNYLLPYYPTTCDFEATSDEWSNRWLVWNFKNTPGKTTSMQHEQALNNVIPRLVSILRSTFGDKLSKLTLVCIPAATAASNNARFLDFSERLTELTQMDNAFGRIQIIEDATPKHLGGSGQPVLRFDSEYFKERNIILFDDVITKGNSMLRYKLKLEQCGAHVIAGLSIGRTKHER